MKIIEKLIASKDKTYSSIRKKFDKHPIAKFIAVALILIFYFLFISSKYGAQDGLLITLLVWSFFVFCTPVADAGILVGFPIRLATGVKMLHSEIIVTVAAFFITAFSYVFNPVIFSQTYILTAYKKIISTPFPYWSIILISTIGTFISVYIADCALDPRKQKKTHVKFLIKYEKSILLVSLLIVIPIYYYLIKSLKLNINF